MGLGLVGTYPHPLPKPDTPVVHDALTEITAVQPRSTLHSD